MNQIKVAAGVLNQTPLDWERNRQNIVNVIQQAKQSNVSILCLPEMCITGYGCEDAFYAPGVHATAAQMLTSIVPETKEIATCVGLPLMYAGGVFNTVCLLVDGKIIGFVAKQHLAGDGIHYEQRWFKPWPEAIQADFAFEGETYPIGDLLFDVGGIRIGFEICEDAWVGARPGASHAARGADLILNPSASHFAFGKHSIRRRFVIEGSRAFNVSYVYANLVGNESGRAIFDGDAIIAASGELLACGPRLGFSDTGFTACNVDIEKTRMTRARTSSFEPDLDGDESDVIACEFDYPAEVSPETPSHGAPWEDSEEVKSEEFARSVALGMFDYMRKSRSKGFVVSLSGGADSSAAAVIVAIAFRFAALELGFDRLLEKLSLSKTDFADIDSLISSYLTTVYQKTENSGEVTRNAAEQVAAAIGSVHLELDVQPMVDAYTSAVESGLGMKLNWDQHDITLQNIQARSRAPSVWMIANLNNALLLATSNRSEAAVGYATMDGDTCGGLSPLAGIDKAFLRYWLRWMENAGPEGLNPIPELKFVNEQQPTAELRPQSSSQTDEGDLMPYEVLDQIERFAIRDKKMPVDVFHQIRTTFPDHEPVQLGNWTIKFFQLWCRNQWKRERYAPSFHLDDENLDPKTWCRFPILSGGYSFEIEQLRSLLKTIE